MCSSLILYLPTLLSLEHLRLSYAEFMIRLSDPLIILHVTIFFASSRDDNVVLLAGLKN